MDERSRKVRAETGTHAAGQSGDAQQIYDDAPLASSESVEELLEEGNVFEAEVVKGVEDAPDADAGPIRVHEIREDDVPEEYLNDENRDVG